MKEQLDTLRDLASRSDQIRLVIRTGRVHVRTVCRSLDVVGGRVLVLVAGQAERVPRIDGAKGQEEIARR